MSRRSASDEEGFSNSVNGLGCEMGAAVDVKNTSDQSDDGGQLFAAEGAVFAGEAKAALQLGSYARYGVNWQIEVGDLGASRAALHPARRCEWPCVTARG